VRDIAQAESTAALRVSCRCGFKIELETAHRGADKASSKYWLARRMTHFDAEPFLFRIIAATVSI
jgi:hypothetical protein